MFCLKRDVYKITEYRDGAVYRTEKVGSIWLACVPHSLEQERNIAIKHGGDMLASTLESQVMSEGFEP